MAEGGFDGIITNPPWEVFKPHAKEFFDDHSDLVTKKKMTIKEFEKEQAKLLRDPEIRSAWLGFLSRFPHVTAYFRSAHQFKNQIAIVDGKKAGGDVNLYKLFLEQCYRFTREGGQCGIVMPGSFYKDLGAKQLREMLFSERRLPSSLAWQTRDSFLRRFTTHKSSAFSYSGKGVRPISSRPLSESTHERRFRRRGWRASYIVRTCT